MILTPGTYQLEAETDTDAFPAISGIAVSNGSKISGLNFSAGNDTIQGTVVAAGTGAPPRPQV